MSPIDMPPRPGLRLATMRDPGSDPPGPTDAAALADVVGTIGAKVESLLVETRSEADEAKAARVATQEALARLESGVLEAIAIGQRVEKRQRDDAAALRRSSSELEQVTLDHSADILRIRTIVAPLMAEASREGSARASKQVGVFGAIATTAAVVAPHIPWGEIGSALARVVGG